MRRGSAEIYIRSNINCCTASLQLLLYNSFSFFSLFLSFSSPLLPKAHINFRMAFVLQSGLLDHQVKVLSMIAQATTVNLLIGVFSNVRHYYSVYLTCVC
jgi:hypothetical protein